MITINQETINQIIRIRDIGAVNMFDTKAVKALAGQIGADNVIQLINTNEKAYINFILHG